MIRAFFCLRNKESVNRGSRRLKSVLLVVNLCICMGGCAKADGAQSSSADALTLPAQELHIGEADGTEGALTGPEGAEATAGSSANTDGTETDIPDTAEGDGSGAAGAAAVTDVPGTGEYGRVSPEKAADDWIRKYGLDTAAEEIDLSGINVRNADMDTIFSRFPNLKRVTMIDCGMGNRGYALLQDRHPDIKIVWEIVLSHWTIRTDAVAFGTFKTTADTFFMDNEEAYYLKYCTDLVALDLGHNYVSDLSFLEYMPELKILILVDNVRLMEDNHLRHLTDLSELRYVPKLRYLEFFANNVSDFSFMQYLPELEDLNISYNSVYSIEYLTDLPNLKRLWMEHTNIPDYAVAQLRRIYPYTQIVSEGEGSIDQGWRSGVRYSAMRRMLRENVIDEIYQ